MRNAELTAVAEYRIKWVATHRATRSVPPDNPMKTALPALLVIPMSLPALQAADQDRPYYEIRRATGRITIDGKLNEADWKTAKSVGPFKFAWWKAGKKEQTVAKLLWDDMYLYVSFRCEDAHVSATRTKRDSSVWKDDCVEVFLAPNAKQPDNYFNIEMNANAAFLDQHHPRGPGKKDKEWNAVGVKIAVTIDGTKNDDSDVDRGWILEAAIPLKNFAGVAANIPPKPGDVWHLNLNRLGGKTNPQFSQWSPSRTKLPQFHAPRDFGRVVFRK
jgi:Carbohydrate-binding family 9